jgi:hypothetical protein
MKNQVIRNIEKHINLILLCFLLTIGSACTQKEVRPTDQRCGIGSGDYEFNQIGYLPASFDGNQSGSFEIVLKPNTHSSYAGFNRLWFELEKDGSLYRSNYVEFNSGDTITQPLEWGGSLPTGVYEVKGYMKNIQLNSTCKDSIYWESQHELGYISITEHAYPSKVMQIEYFCQTSYNVFSSPHTSEYMNIAFNIANTRDNVITYNTNLTPQLIVFRPNNPWEIRRYIFDLKQWEDEMFLCGIKGFKDTLGYYHPEYTGVTYVFSTIVPACSTGSLVAVKACIDLVANEYDIDYNDFVTATTIHELGHQRASILHEDYHDSPFCIMHLGLVVIGDRNRYSNPHFCNYCISRLKNINW